VITPGQRADCTQFERVMDEIRVPGTASAGHGGVPESVGADKAYSNGVIRAYLRDAVSGT
jgi:hypothetical protein